MIPSEKSFGLMNHRSSDDDVRDDEHFNFEDILSHGQLPIEAISVTCIEDISETVRYNDHILK